MDGLAFSIPLRFPNENELFQYSQRLQKLDQPIDTRQIDKGEELGDLGSLVEKALNAFVEVGASKLLIEEKTQEAIAICMQTWFQ